MVHSPDGHTVEDWSSAKAVWISPPPVGVGALGTPPPLWHVQEQGAESKEQQLGLEPLLVRAWVFMLNVCLSSELIWKVLSSQEPSFTAPATTVAHSSPATPSLHLPHGGPPEKRSWGDLGHVVLAVVEVSILSRSLVTDGR